MQVSEKHANFFVNVGNGTAKEALALIELVEREVFAKLNVKLTREFEFWSS
jgi:UDP-N-acetylmuramate dehydrogenase